MEPQNSTILIVDDDPNNQFIIKSLLKKDGYNTVSAMNGEEALSILEETYPDLILLDIMMPKMTGHEAAKIIKKTPKISEIPILFISTLNDTKNILQAFEHGAVDFITKPFRKPEVLARVKTHLELRELRKKAELHALEMEQFAYMAAHDLKSPSNAIKNLSRHIQEGSELDIEELSYRISNSSTKLCSLVDSLLQLSEGSKKNFYRKELILTDLINELKEELHEELSEVQGSIHFDSDNTIFSESTIMKILLSHLITNSIKYSDSSRPLEIDISLTDKKENSELTIRDNGTGLKIDKSNNPFQAFSRFHGMHIDGHGLGLTICKRIVDGHKGQIKLESTLGKGTTIFIVFPKY